MDIYKGVLASITILEMDNKMSIKDKFDSNELGNSIRDISSLIEKRLYNDDITYDMIFGVFLFNISKVTPNVLKIDTSKTYFHQFLNSYYYNKEFNGNTILTEDEKLFSMGVQYALDNYMPGKKYGEDCCKNCEKYIEWERQKFIQDIGTE